MSEPTLSLEAREAVRVEGSWRVRWSVTSAGGDHVRLVAARAPHLRFHSDPIDLNVVVMDTTSFEQTLHLEASPGDEIEIAFVIFVVVKDRETWRVLFRVRVLVAADGSPSPVVEAMSTHRIGLSEV